MGLCFEDEFDGYKVHFSRQIARWESKHLRCTHNLGGPYLPGHLSSCHCLGQAQLSSTGLPVPAGPLRPTWKIRGPHSSGCALSTHPPLLEYVSCSSPCRRAACHGTAQLW